MRIPSFLRRNPEAKVEIAREITDADSLPATSRYSDDGEGTLSATSREGAATEGSNSDGEPVSSKAAAAERRRRSNRRQAKIDRAAENARLLMKRGVGYRR